MSFRIRALNHKDFSELFDLEDSDLQKIGAVRMRVDSFPGFPCRVSLQDAEVGEEVILLPYEHHKTVSPYQSKGPIFVRRFATTSVLGIDEVPKMLHHRLLSLRAYTEHGMMKNATVVEGQQLKEQIVRLFDDLEISYIHIHNAKPGCYNCMVERP